MSHNNERDRLINWAKQLADPNWCLSVPKEAKDVIAQLVNALEPRQVTTVEELDALRKNAVIMQPGGTVLVHDGQVEDPWASYAEDPFGGPIWTSSAYVTLPVTVLHEGDTL